MSNLVNKSFEVFGKATIKAKLTIALFFVVFFVLFNPELFSNDLLIPLYIYALVLLGYQTFCVYKIYKKTGVLFPPETKSIVVSIVLVLITPLADIILARDYPLRASVLFITANLVFILMYMFEIYQVDERLK